MTADGPLFEKYKVEKKGEPDPPGSRYFVLDYVNDPHARIPTRCYVNLMQSVNQEAYAAALKVSLAGGDEDPVLRTYDVERTDGKVKEGARYVVLNYSHSYAARVALRMYVGACSETHPELSKDLERELDQTMDAYKAHMESKNPPKRGRGRPRKY